MTTIDELQNKIQEADSDGTAVLDSYNEEFVKIKMMVSFFLHL